MAAKLIVILSLAIVACVYAAPATTPSTESTTETGEDVILVEEIAVKEIPVVVAFIEPTTALGPETKETSTTSQPKHKLVKRATLRGDNPSQDLLANFDAIQFENGISSLDGRRIKFLPTWVG